MNHKIKVPYKKSYTSKLLAWVTRAAAMLAMAVLIFIIGFILVKGVRYLSPELFSPHYTSENSSLFPALVNTLFMTVLTLLIAAPIGISAAIFLVEYSDHEGKVAGVIRVTAETLSGIPSIVYGLFGMLFFSTALGWGYSMLAGAFTMAIMILPLIMRTSEEALVSVPVSYREASFGLGAGRLRTIFKVVLPAAVPGILSGIILAVGRVVGETAALIFTAGTVAEYAGFMDSGRTLAVHMYVLSSEGLHMDQAYATAVVLLIFVFAMNRLSEYAAERISKGHVHE